MKEDVKRIPYGISDFVEVVERNQYYVDKTMYLPLLEDQPSNLFFIRPRRFGKSIFLSMLRAYYDIAQKEKFGKRFGNLWVGAHPTPLQGKYQVLYLDFSRVGGMIQLDKLDGDRKGVLRKITEEGQIITNLVTTFPAAAIADPEIFPSLLFYYGDTELPSHRDAIPGMYIGTDGGDNGYPGIPLK